MAELSQEERTRQEGLIRRVLNEGAPEVVIGKGRFFVQSGTGSMANYFTNFQTQNLTLMRTNGISAQDVIKLEAFARSTDNKELIAAVGKLKSNGSIVPGKIGTEEENELVVSAMMKVKVDEEKSRIAAMYIGGAANNNSTSVQSQTGETINQIGGVLGIGGGLFGMLSGFISRIPVVGDYILAAGRVGGSMIESLVGAIGLGDKNAKMMGFTAALQEVRDAKRFGGGAQSLSTLGGVDMAGVINDLNRVAATPPGADDKKGQPAPKVEMVQYKTVEGKMKSAEAEGLDAFKKMLIGDKPGDGINYKEEPYQTQLNALKEALKKTNGLDPNANYMLVTLPDGKFAIATGALDSTGSKLVPDKYLVVGKDGKLEKLEQQMEPVQLPSNRVSTPATTAISNDKVIQPTLSDSLKDLKARMVDIAPQVPADLQSSLQAIQIGLTTDPDKKFPELAGKKHVLIRTDDNKLAIVSGSFDPATNNFKPEKITRLNERNELMPPEDYRGATKALSVKPTDLLGAKPQKGFMASGVDKLRASIKGAAGIDPAVVSLLENSPDVVKQLAPDVVIDNKNVPMTFIVMEQAGGKKVIVGGKLETKDKENPQFTPMLIIDREAGSGVAMPRTLQNSPPVTLDKSMLTGLPLPEEKGPSPETMTYEIPGVDLGFFKIPPIPVTLPKPAPKGRGE